MPISRRHMLGASATLLASSLLPVAHALPTARRDLRFLFVMNYGGWDVTRVFLPAYDNPNVHMEADGQRRSAGGIDYVNHPERPAVRAFFDAHHARSLVLNGVLVPSVAHEACLKLAFTGSTADGLPDWPALVASARAPDYAMPQLVIAGPSFPGPYGGVVSRVGEAGQLAGLLDGDLTLLGSQPVGPPDAQLQALMQELVDGRGARALANATGEVDQQLLADWVEGSERAQRLKGLSGALAAADATTMSGQLDMAVSALAAGACRCASVSYTGEESWDSHFLNDEYQSLNFQGLFTHLSALMARLEGTLGTNGEPLSEQTVVVVLSEMGRSPQLNSSEGKDHWPYTSAMLIGPGVTGSRVVGGQDALFYGQRVDPASGELSESGVELHSSALGATLLALADADPGALLPGAAVIEGVLA